MMGVEKEVNSECVSVAHNGFPVVIPLSLLNPNWLKKRFSLKTEPVSLRRISDNIEIPFSVGFVKNRNHWLRGEKTMLICASLLLLAETIPAQIVNRNSSSSSPILCTFSGDPNQSIISKLKSDQEIVNAEDLNVVWRSYFGLPPLDERYFRTDLRDKSQITILQDGHYRIQCTFPGEPNTHVMRCLKVNHILRKYFCSSGCNSATLDYIHYFSKNSIISVKIVVATTNCNEKKDNAHDTVKGNNDCARDVRSSLTITKL